MVIDAGKSQILVRLGTKRLEEQLFCRGRVHLASRDFVEQILELFV
jgi:hypothetical protein